MANSKQETRSLGNNTKHRQKATKTELQPREGFAEKITLFVVHGNLSFARFPVAVGHYQEDAIVSAEKGLDHHLNGRLTERYRLGLYPGAIQSNDVILKQDQNGNAMGAIIVGLGKVGELSSNKLTRSFRNAVLQYALHYKESKLFNKTDIGLSALLIGTGGGGLSLEDAMLSLLNALVEANYLLQMIEKPLIKTLEFIELYEETAVLAQRRLQRLKKSRLLQQHFDLQDLHQADGGRYRLVVREDNSWWERLQITGMNGSNNTLKFTHITQRARAESQVVGQQRSVVDRFLEEATKTTQTDVKLSRTLFELLIPKAFKQQAIEQHNVLLILDDISARYPWELLEYSERDNIKKQDKLHSPATEAGMIRQLMTDYYDKNPLMTLVKRALIIGDPVSNFPELRGAQKEARQVERLCLDHAYSCKTLIKSNGLSVLSDLMTEQYQILHLAGHGVFECELSDNRKTSEKVTGMVLGENMFLTPIEIKQMPRVPELVFINCCFLGKMTDNRKAIKATLLQSRHHFAANISTQLIRAGVRIVIAAGWAVDDDAASTFAACFYESLFSGDNFGFAVQQARLKTKERHPETNTWGAYQCYGDQHYCLPSNGTVTQQKNKTNAYSFVHQREAEIELDNLASDARSASDKQIKILEEKLENLQQYLKKRQPKWFDKAGIQSGFAKVFGEMGFFSKAIKSYELALLADKAQLSIGALEQLSNFEARWAIECHKKNHTQQAKQLIINAKQRLQQLCELLDSQPKKRLKTKTRCLDSVERLALRGSACKRSAMIMSDNDRIDELKEMHFYYQQADKQAFKKANEVDTYARSNLLTAQFLLHILAKQAYPNDFEAQLQQIKQKKKKQLSQKHFWDAIAYSDVLLLESLCHDNLAQSKEELINRYQEQQKRASSPRQFSSVLEHIEFLVEMLKAKNSEDNTERATALLEIYQKLRKG